MKKSKIKLNKAIKLKAVLESSINSDNQLIEEWNSIISGNKREVDIDSIEEVKDIKSEYLIELNIAIQEANFKKGSGEKFCNAYYIKKRAELQRELAHIKLINTNDGNIVVDDNNQQQNKKNKKKIIAKYDAYIKYSDVITRIKNIESKIQALANKLSLFNEQQYITINVDNKLLPILEEVGIE
jgi:hypothetical protein